MNETSWVTEVLRDSFSFRWTVKDINQFNELEALNLESPIFTGGQFTKHSWQIIISTMENGESSQDIGFYLRLTKVDENCKRNEFHAKFEIEISRGDEMQASCVGHGRFAVGVKIGQDEVLTFDDTTESDEDLIISCNVLFEREHVHRNESGFVMQDEAIVSQKPVLTADDLKELWETSEDADVTIQTDTESFKAHRLILSCRSPVLKKMCFASKTESKLYTLEIKGFQADIVKGMLDFAYGQPVIMTEENALDYLRIAAKYELKELRQMSEAKFVHDYLQVGNTIDALLLADMYNGTELKERLLEYFAMNKQAVMKTEPFEILVETNRKLFIEICRL